MESRSQSSRMFGIAPYQYAPWRKSEWVLPWRYDLQIAIHAGRFACRAERRHGRDWRRGCHLDSVGADAGVRTMRRSGTPCTSQQRTPRVQAAPGCRPPRRGACRRHRRRRLEERAGRARCASRAALAGRRAHRPRDQAVASASRVREGRTEWPTPRPWGPPCEASAWPIRAATDSSRSSGRKVSVAVETTA
jgi:hypothetical protein